MNFKRDIIVSIILALISFSIVGLLSFITAGDYFILSLLPLWIVLNIIFVPISIILVFDKFFYVNSSLKEIILTTIFCLFLIAIPLLPELIHEFIDSIKLEKSSKVTKEFAEACNSAIEKVDPSFCDKLNTEEWKQKEKEADYDNEGVRTYNKCCSFASDWVLSKNELSESDKWSFCMKITEYLERQECYSVLLERINPKTRIYPINLSCDLIDNEKTKQECDEINKRTEAEKNAYNSYDSHKIKSYDMSGCDLLRPFQKAICYSFIASTENGFGICSDLSLEIIETDKPFGDSDKTQREICEFYCDKRI